MSVAAVCGYVKTILIAHGVERWTIPLGAIAELVRRVRLIIPATVSIPRECQRVT
jgi:hypothetical protein